MLYAYIWWHFKGLNLIILEHRYIELFLNSTPAGRSDGGMGMSSGGNSSFGNNSMNDGFDNFDNDSGMMGNSQMGMMGKGESCCNPRLPCLSKQGTA